MSQIPEICFSLGLHLDDAVLLDRAIPAHPASATSPIALDLHSASPIEDRLNAKLDAGLALVVLDPAIFADNSVPPFFSYLLIHILSI